MSIVFNPPDPNDCTSDWNAAIASTDHLIVPPGDYYFRSLPAPIPHNITIQGLHVGNTVLVYEPDVFEDGNFFDISNLGGNLQGFSLLGWFDDHRTVTAIKMANDATTAGGYWNLRDIRISGDYSSWWRNIYINGSAKETDPHGWRGCHWWNVECHGVCKNPWGVTLWGVQGFSGWGGQVFCGFALGGDSHSVVLGVELQGPKSINPPMPIFML